MVTPDPIEFFGKGQSHYAQQFVKSAINGRGTRIWSTSSLDNVGNGEVTITSETGAQVTFPCDSVVARTPRFFWRRGSLVGSSGIQKF
jgi:hypothetical protein